MSTAQGYRSSRAAAEATAHDITESGGEAMLCHLDVTVADTVDACLRSVVEHWGRVDVLVNTAGRLEAEGAVRGLTVDMARELAPGIRVNAVAPGPISGQWEQEWDVSGGQIEDALRTIPLGRFGLPEEIAETPCSCSPTAPATSPGRSSMSMPAGWLGTDR